MNTVTLEHQLTREELLDKTDDPSNKDLFNVDGGSDRIRYLHWGDARGEIHFVASINRRVVGIGAVRVNPFDDSVLWVKFVSVEAALQGNGIGKLISEAIFNYAQSERKRLHVASFSPMGKQRLLPLFHRLAVEHPELFCGCSDCGVQIAQRQEGTYKNE